MTNTKLTVFRKQEHPFHLVDPSPWPILTAFGLGKIALNSAIYWAGYAGYFGESDFVLSSLDSNSLSMTLSGSILLALKSDLDFILVRNNEISFMFFFFFVYCWFSDIVAEGTYQGRHTKAVQKGLKLGMALFILSEVMFFSAFFWGFFYVSIVPHPLLGNVWPPAYITPIDAWGLPLVNTIILLSSGATVTWAHRAMILGSRRYSIIGLGLTVFLGVIFMFCQYIEYESSPFSIRDSVYGSLFFMITGFHGFHVFVGTLFLFVCFLRLVQYHFLTDSFLGFEFAAWYWHFVDVVWLFVFVFIYWWGA